MEYRLLGRTGVRVSPICLGCWMFGGKANREESAAIIDRAIDMGVNFLDTANVYQSGLSEEYVGETLFQNGKRQRIVLATKVHFRVSEDDPNAFGNSRRHILEQCDTSLAGGLLTGKYRRDRPHPSDSRFVNAADDPMLQPRLNERAFEVCEALDPLAEEKGCTLSQLSLAWCACQPGVTSPIIGPRTVDQLEDNLGALEVDLSQDDLGRIDSMVPPGRMISPFYEADFGPHRHRW